MSLEALIFDVDGTLADTEEAHRLAFNQAFCACGLNWYWPRPRYAELLQVAGGKERIAAHIENRPLERSARVRLLDLVPRIHAAKTRYYKLRFGQGLVRPGKSAGVFTVVPPSPWTWAQDFSAADLVVPSLADPEEPLQAADAARIGARYVGLEQLAAFHAAAAVR